MEGEGREGGGGGEGGGRGRIGVIGVIGVEKGVGGGEERVSFNVCELCLSC